MKKLYAIAWLALMWALMPQFTDASLNCSQNYSCDLTVHETLRYDRSYLFEDVFHANKWDKYLWERCVNFSEPYDYNLASNPTFDFTSELENNDWKVPSYGSMTVLTSSPAYRIKAVPPTRASDNLAVKYTLEYSDDEAGNQTHAHTECIYYEISRCGDGIVDTNYWETCDPNDSSKKNFWNGWCDNSCKPVTVAAPVCNSDYNGQRVETLVDGSYLCKEWSIAWFTYNPSTYTWTWKCNNTAWSSVNCSAVKPYCWDGVLDAWETCDPNDSSKKNFWNGWCDNSCKPITIDAPVCNSTYNWQRVDNLTAQSALCTKWGSIWFTYNPSTYTWTWRCENSLGSWVDCSAIKPYCWDGILDTWETCDPEDKTNKKWWWNGWCSNTCQPVTIDWPACNSTYNWQRVDNLTAQSNLCTRWSVTWFTYNPSTYTWTWGCENSIREWVDCSAIKPYCWDGVLDAWETCDPKDSSRKNFWNGWCDSSCKPVTIADPVCSSSYNGKRVDNLVEWSYLCSEWTVTWFTYNSTTHTWTWKCKNTLWSWVDCSAIKPYCWDGIKDSWELCDYNDKTEDWWWSDWCDTYCTPIDSSSDECDETFYDKLRYKREYSFDDNFNSWWNDSWLRDFNVVFDEPKDYNKWPNPTFSWSTELKNNNMKVWKNQTMKVIESSPKYQILDTPDKRARDNLYVEYTIKYATSQTSTREQSHKECIYYEISRCGDWVLDTDYNEICDPADPNQVGWWNGWCDDSCKPVTKVDAPECNSEYNWQTVLDLVVWDYLCTKWTVTWFTYNPSTYTWTWRCENSVGTWVDCSAKKPVEWTLLIEKTLVWSKEIKNTWDLITWNIKVTATWWDVTDFVITDHLPSILWYSGYQVTHNPWLTVSTPSVTWNDVVWDVKWTLKKWEYVEIRLTTYAKEMPKVDYVNVACVKENPNDPDKCDEVEVPVEWTLLIEKTLVWSKEIKNTWDLITWNIKVTATWWDVTDFVITDKLPNVLKYSTYTVINNPWLTVSEPIISWKNIVWNVSWTLQEGKSLEISLVTSVTEMPKVDYVNVACVKWTNPNDPEKCDNEDLPVMKVRIKKTFTDGTKVKNVQIWDEVAYRISFWNSWTASASITSLKDFLPKNVSYVTWSIFINGESVHTNVASWSEVINSGTKIDWVYVDIYGWITLNPWDSWYIILTWKVLSDHQDSRTNFACIYVNDEKIDCDDARHDLTGSLMCMAPEITTRSFSKSWGSTAVVCKTSPAWEKAASIELDCGNGTVITWSNIASLSWTCTYPANSSSSSKSYSVVCKVNGETADNCKWLVTVSGGWSSGWDDPHCKAPEIVNSWDYIKEVTCKTDNWEDYLIGISCHSWDSIHVSSWRVSSFTYTCKYDKAWNYDIQCYVPKSKNATEVTKNDTKPSQCGTWVKIDALCKSVKVDPASWTSTNRSVSCETNLPANEVESIAIYCNYTWSASVPVKTWSKTSTLTWTCSYGSNWTYKVQCVVNWKVESSCEATAKKSSGSSWGGGHPGWSTPSTHEIPNCFNVNDWNVSIEQWEVLPIYFNISKLDLENRDVEEVELNKYPYWNAWNYDAMLQNGSCNTNWAVALNSMMCTFRIFNGQDDIHPVKTIKVPCLSWYDGWSDPAIVSDKPLINSWMRWSIDKYAKSANWRKVFWSVDTSADRSYAFRTNIAYIEDFGKWYNIFWEYKTRLAKVEYLYCDNGKLKEWTPSEDVCESNFMLTNSYTVQKTPSWNLEASTTELDKYLYMDGTTPISWSTLLNAIAITAADYKWNPQLEAALQSFINKYEKLSVKVNSTKFGNTATIKKVPWKDIYFISWNVTFAGKDSSITKPFTIVQTAWNTTIRWSMSHNMMLLTKWDIIFEWNCTEDQEVKWVFYAQRNVVRAWMIKNDSLDHNVWCTNWWLHVKWVLIGWGLNNLMAKSRSNLNNWFSNNDKTYRKWLIMNWASVLIEYSPSVFTKSTMPPGAEDFTTALSIYKN